LVCHPESDFQDMKKQKTNAVERQKKKKKNKEDDIAILKEKIRHQKEALTKIIKKYSDEK